MRENVLKAGAVSLVGSSFSAASALLVAVVVGRSLGTSGTGIFFQAVAIFAILSAVLMLGTSSGVIWALSRQRAAGTVGGQTRVLAIALGPVLAVSVVVSVTLHAAAHPVAEFLAGSQVDVLEDVLRLLSWFLPLSAVMGALHTAVRVMRGVISFSLLQDVSIPLSRLVGVSVAAAVGVSAYTTIVYWVASIPLWFLVTVAWLVRPVVADLRTRVRRSADSELGPSEFWRYSSARALGVAIEFGLDWVDVLVVAAVRSPAEAAVYAVASRAIQAGRVAERAVRVASGPTIAWLLARGERQEASELHLMITRVAVLISWPYYLMLIVMGPAVLSLFGEGFREGAFVVAILALVTMVAVSAGMLQSILLMGGRSTWQVYNKSVALALSVGGNLALVPHLGINGAALTWVIVVVTDTSIAAWLVHARMGVHLAPNRLVRAALVPVAVFGLGGWGLRLVLGTGALDLLVWLLVLAPVYAGALWLFRERLDLVSSWQVASGRGASPNESPSVTVSAPAD
jgi:O-antigen/teichoic acid export membrane protein